MRAELWSDAAIHLASFDVPPFKKPPAIVAWNERRFVLRGNQTSGYLVWHLATCQSRVDPTKACSCGGVYAYDEANIHVLLDMHRVESGRDKPITTPPPKESA